MTLGFIIGWIVVGLGFIAIGGAILLKIDEDRQEARRRATPWTVD